MSDDESRLLDYAPFPLRKCEIIYWEKKDHIIVRGSGYKSGDRR